MIKGLIIYFPLYSFFKIEKEWFCLEALPIQKDAVHYLTTDNWVVTNDAKMMSGFQHVTDILITALNK